MGGTLIQIRRDHCPTTDYNNGRKDGRKELAKNQQFVIELLLENNTLTAIDLAGKANLGERTIYRILAELQKDGYVERVGTRKSGYWKIL